MDLIKIFIFNCVGIFICALIMQLEPAFIISITEKGILKFQKSFFQLFFNGFICGTLIHFAVKNKKPMMGICRGHQVINVFMGGNLIQDIGQHHRNTRHKVYMNENDLIKFPKEIETNSYHHQVCKDLAPGLIELGKSYDNYNEAYISKEYPIISAQWHPEKTLDEEPSKIIFDYFKNLVLENKK